MFKNIHIHTYTYTERKVFLLCICMVEMNSHLKRSEEGQVLKRVSI